MTTSTDIINRIVAEAAERLEFEHLDSSLDFLYDIEVNNFFSNKTKLVRDGNYCKCANCGKDRYIIGLPTPNYCENCGLEFFKGE